MVKIQEQKPLSNLSSEGEDAVGMHVLAVSICTVSQGSNGALRVVLAFVALTIDSVRAPCPQHYISPQARDTIHCMTPKGQQVRFKGSTSYLDYASFGGIA